jgi:hypothetical protein
MRFRYGHTDIPASARAAATRYGTSIEGTP